MCIFFRLKSAAGVFACGGAKEEFMKKLDTQWTVDTEKPWHEYPRPQLRRRSYINLNGSWNAAVTTALSQPKEYNEKILVPFSPESPLSGAEYTLLPGQYLWYNRFFDRPELPENGRLLLHFGAVDQSCRVYVNGIKVGEHVGGYLPFSFDITECLLDGSNELTVVVKDDLDESAFARGKQGQKSHGIWYRSVSGIWQTVWMEAVPDVYITSLRITPLFDTNSVNVKITTNKPFKNARAGIMQDRTIIAAEEFGADGEITFVLDDPHSWSPDDPYLYDLVIVADEDRAKSYFGMRKWSVGKDNDDIPRLMLNNKPFFFNGLLDQGYWSDGIYTAPSDDALVYDIVTAKELGYNTLRKHAKVEQLRWYYHCDRLGMVVWQDMVNGGGRYNPYTIYVANRVGNMADGRSKRGSLARKDAFGRLSYIEDASAEIELLYNCVSLALWTPFNEGWGQFDSDAAVNYIRERDNTRFIDAASGWFEQKSSDVISRHVYFKKFTVPRKNPKPFILSEFGGYSCPIGGHVMTEHTFGYKTFNNMITLTENYSKLFCSEIIPAIQRGLCACIYTQLSDVEQEVNGIMTYDRKILKVDANAVKSINSRLTY